MVMILMLVDPPRPTSTQIELRSPTGSAQDTVPYHSFPFLIADPGPLGKMYTLSLSLSLYIYIYIYIHTCIYIYIYVIIVYIYIYIYMCIHSLRQLDLDRIEAGPGKRRQQNQT